LTSRRIHTSHDSRQILDIGHARYWLKQDSRRVDKFEYRWRRFPDAPGDVHNRKALLEQRFRTETKRGPYSPEFAVFRLPRNVDCSGYLLEYQSSSALHEWFATLGLKL
jgi:hypothetical protein